MNHWPFSVSSAVLLNYLKPVQIMFEIPITDCTSVIQHVMHIHVILTHDYNAYRDKLEN